MSNDELPPLRGEAALKSELWFVAERHLRGRGIPIKGRSDDDVRVEYLALYPSVQQWVDENIAAGTCDEAAHFLREQRRSHEEIERAHLAMLKRRMEWFRRLKGSFDLVSLQRIADWLARPCGDLMPDEERREQAYGDLRQAIADGEFGPREKPDVVFFPNASMGKLLPATTITAPGQLRLRMTPRVAAILALDGIEPLSEGWAPRANVIKWYAARQHLLPPAPPWLAATDSSRSRRQPHSPEEPPAADPKPAALATPRRCDKEVKIALQRYIDDGRTAGRLPNIDRAWKYIQQHLPGASRDHQVRPLYRQIVGHKRRGRPSK